MSGKTVSLGAPYRWLGESFAICRAHPRVIFGAAALLMAVALLPSVLQLLLETALRPSMAVRWVLQAVFSIMALIVFPPIVGGFYRITHALHEGRPANAFDLFAVFQDGAAALRLIVTNLIFVVISIVVLLGLALAFGGQPLLDFIRAMGELQPGATSLPPFPDGLMALMSMLMILGLVIMTAQGLATANVALSATPLLAATGVGFGAALRNIAAFLLFYIPLAVISFVVAMILVLVVALLAGMLSVVNPMLAAALIAPVSLVLVLLLYALMFTFYYHAWRDTLGPGAAIENDHHLIA
jgi:hypothetical protein